MFAKHGIAILGIAALSCSVFANTASALTMTYKDGVIQGSYNPSEDRRKSVQRKAKKQCPSKKSSFFGEKKQADGTVKFEMRCQ